jgi:hypothetical protein
MIELAGLFGNAFWAVFGAAVPEVLKWGRRKYVLSLASHVFPTNRDSQQRAQIHLRTSLDCIEYGENPSTLRGYTHSGDMVGAMAVMKYFHDLPVDVEFDYFSEITNDMKNVVLMGASSRSDVCREIAADLYDRGIRVRGTNVHAYFRDASGKEYHCEHSECGGKHIVTKDVGLIFRKISDTGVDVLLCGGIHTFGTQAAAHVALSADFQRKVRKSRLREFVQFVTVDVIRSGDRAGLALQQHTIRWRDLPLQKIA